MLALLKSPVDLIGAPSGFHLAHLNPSGFHLGPCPTAIHTFHGPHLPSPAGCVVSGSS
jgi:hypothetical protein